MQVKLMSEWRLNSLGAWLFQRSAYLGLLCAMLLAGCASVKAPDLNAAKPPQSPADSATVTAVGEPPVAPKVLHLGLALGGGAARGFAHVGVIQVLE